MEQRALDAVVGEGDIAQFRAIGDRVFVVEQHAARGRQLVVRDQGADQANAAAAVQHRQARRIAVVFDTGMQKGGVCIVRNGRAMGGGIAKEIDPCQKISGGGVTQTQSAAMAIGAVVLETGHAGVEHVVGQDRAAAGQAVAVAQPHVAQVQGGTGARFQEAERGGRDIALQSAVLQGNGVDEDRQSVGTIGVDIGAVGKHQGMAVQIDVVIQTIDVGTLDGLP